MANTNEAKAVNSTNEVMLDLQGRAMYGVKFPVRQYDPEVGDTLDFNATVHSVKRVFGLTESESYPIRCVVESNAGQFDVAEVRPYLRPMKDMYEWEKAEYAALCGKGGYDYDACNCHGLVDWCNAHYIDYRNLIGKGLALPAPEGMYRDALSRLCDADCYPEPDEIFHPMEKGPHESEGHLFRSGCGSLS